MDKTNSENKTEIQKPFKKLPNKYDTYRQWQIENTFGKAIKPLPGNTKE